MIGRIVYSKAGSDKGRILVIVGKTEEKVLVCDGKRHKLKKPKIKNPKHIILSEEMLNMNEITTDKLLRKALAIYRSKLK